MFGTLFGKHLLITHFNVTQIFLGMSKSGFYEGIASGKRVLNFHIATSLKLESEITMVL
jgi:hypothetical protein